AWAPFRHRQFALMWSAQFVSNIGSWMQTVAAQWLMLTLTGSGAHVALVFAVGTGQALTSPTWQTLQPELVSPAERPQAISLGSVNQNLARAVGPAIGGALLAATGAGTVFLVNAVTFVAVIGVIAAWRSARAPDVLPREHVGEAIRAGGRYVAGS